MFEEEIRIAKQVPLSWWTIAALVVGLMTGNELFIIIPIALLVIMIFPYYRKWKSGRYGYKDMYEKGKSLFD